MDIEGILAGGVVSLATALVTVAYTDWRNRKTELRASRRASADAVATWHRATLHDTRRAIPRRIAMLEAAALGELDEAARHGLVLEDLDEDYRLIGDVDAIQAYQETVVALRRRFGRGLSPQYSVRSAKAVGLVLSALDRQEERLLRGEPLTVIDESVAPELFSADRLAARLRLPWRLPSGQVLLARLWLDLQEWLDRRIGRR